MRSFAFLAVTLLLISSCRTANGPGPVAESSVDEGMLRISWRLQSQEDVYGFDVYRGDSEDGPFERVTPQPVPGHDTTAVPQQYEFYDTGLEVGRTYHYYVEEITYSGGRDTITPVVSASAKLRQHYLDKGYEVPSAE